MTTAWVITIGNEILIGKIVNTNATWLCQKLTSMGIQVNRIICVPDEEEDIAEVFKEAIKKKIDIVISTGGLGPTFDDKTSYCIAKALNLEYQLNQEALKMIEEKYKEKNMELTEHRIKMAKMPKDSEPIRNPIGTAPGIMLRYGKTMIFALPGVPSEMKAMFEETVSKVLRKISGQSYAETYLKVIGVPESSIAPLIEEVMEAISGVYIKSHPRGRELGEPLLEIHFSAIVDEKSKAQRIVSEAKELFKKLVVNEFREAKLENG